MKVVKERGIVGAVRPRCYVCAEGIEKEAIVGATEETEDALAELCQAQGEPLEECHRERDKLLVELREIIFILEENKHPGCLIDYTARERAVLARAKKALGGGAPMW